MLVVWRWRGWRIVRLLRGLARADVIGELSARKAEGEAVVGFGKHSCVPGEPLGNQPVVDVLVPLLKVGAFHWIIHDVEEEPVFEDLEVLPVSVACGALGVCLIAPEELARNGGPAPGENGQKVDAIGRA